MKKYKFTTTKYKAPRFNAGMAGERIIEIISKYIALDVILMLLGLLHEADGMRGYPQPWLGHNSDPAKFFVSLIIVTAVVIAGDIITRIAIKATEPENKVQRTVAQYSSSYEDYSDDEEPVVVSTVSSQSGKSSSKYIKSLSDDYEKVRKLIDSNTSFDKQGSRSGGTKVISNMLNGAKPSSGKGKDSNNGKSTLIICGIIAIALSIFSFVDIFDDSGDEYLPDDDWENIEYEAEDESEYEAEDSAFVEMADSYIDQWMTGEYEWFEDIAGDDPDALDEMTDWSDSSFEEIFSFESGSDPASSVIRYLIETTDGYYIAAFRWANDGDSYDTPLIGFAVSKCPEDEDGNPIIDIANTLYHDSYYSEDALREFEAEMQESMVMTGDCIIDDWSILLR